MKLRMPVMVPIQPLMSAEFAFFICDVFTESLDIEFKPKTRYKPVMSLGNYENPKLTYRYLHKDRFRERR